MKPLTKLLMINALQLLIVCAAYLHVVSLIHSEAETRRKEKQQIYETIQNVDRYHSRR